MTLKKIAKLSGVSIGTVDRVLHGRGRVSKSTELKIKKIIEKHGYKPNIFASHLSSSRLYTFGIMIPNRNQDGKYWAILENGIEKALKELSIYNIKAEYFFFDRHDENSLKKTWESMLKAKVNGLLMAPILTDLSKELIINELPKNITLIFVDSFIPELNYISYIGQDSYQSGVLSAKLMQMLIQKKGTIAVVRVMPDDYHINERVKGFNSFFKAFKEYRIKSYDVFNSDDISEFNIVSNKIISENKDLNGIFITNASTHYIAKNLKTHILNKKIHIIGYDLIDKNIHYLKEGVIDFLISQKPESQGYQGIYALYRSIVLKEKVNKKKIMPIDIITKENINYYIEQGN
jgi:LacI family transcriptional regulator